MSSHFQRARAAEIARLFRVAPRPPVVEWLEGNIILPRKTSPTAPGRFTTAGRPFMRWILETWSPSSGVTTCAVAAAVQLFKSTVLALGACYRLRWDPVPMLIVGPSAEWTKRELSEKRFMPLINENPSLASEKPADLDHFRNMHMAMRGCDLIFVGANSDTGLAGATCGIVAIDEAAKIKHGHSEDAPEAHPIHLAMKRTEAFGTGAFHYLSSTPNTPDHPFWKIVEAGSFTHPAVECPHCHEWFNLELDEDRERDYRPLIWAKNARAADGTYSRQAILETSRYICPKNGCEIQEEHRRRMIATCEPDEKNKAAPSTQKTFRVNFLHNPNLEWGEAAWQFLEAQRDLFGMQDFVNSRLARPWEEMAANIKDEDVRKLRDLADYRRGILRRKPAMLGILADVGDYRTHYEVGAVYENLEMDIIDWGTVLTIEDLQSLAKKLRYPIAGTSEVIAPSRGLVDSRDQTVRVYDMCARSRGFWWPAAGSDAREGTWGMKPLKTHPIEVFTFNTHQFKKELYVHLIKQQRAPRLYFPRDTEEELIAGHSGQQLIIANGREQWKKIPNDHYGDCTLRLLLLRLLLQFQRGSAAPDMIAPDLPAANSFPTS